MAPPGETGQQVFEMHGSEEEADDDLQLSAGTLAALQEFLAEQKQSQEQADAPVSIGAFAEDWQLSQFWYSDETADALAREMLSETGPGSRLACLSCPSTYFATKRPEFKDQVAQRSIRLLEFDQRFASAAGEEFVFYDYKNPLGLPDSLKGSFDYLMVDPPFLSDECWARTSETVKWLSAPGAKVACCTGAIMADKVFKELGCKESRFHPVHRGGLANEFRCFVSYTSKNKEESAFSWVGETSLP